jgi:hypothetical protein
MDAAAAEASSEEEALPIESALLRNGTAGWRAAKAGNSNSPAILDMPQKLRHIALVFEENETKRT